MAFRAQQSLTPAVQDFFENRDIFNSLELGWELLRILPTTMLGRIKMKTIDKCAIFASLEGAAAFFLHVLAIFLPLF